MKDASGRLIRSRPNAFVKFAAAIREKLAPIEEGSKVAGWLVWAEGYADRIDPLRQT